MHSKLIPLLIVSSFLTSCCWFSKEDCAESFIPEFTIPVDYNYTDSLIQVNEALPISILTSEFLPTYTEQEYQQSNFYMDIIWFNGDFSSSANSKVDLLSNSVSQFNLTEYQGFSGDLPNDINLELAFTIPGYYLILLNGGSSKDYETANRRKDRCSCGGYAYQSFFFESNNSNEQFYPIYENSSEGYSTLASLQNQGAFFIKVE